MDYISTYYSSDYNHTGFHLIRGNHKRELWPVFPLNNLPDIIVIKGAAINYYIVHAGIVSKATTD